MSVWSAAVVGELFAAPDPREEAREYDKLAVGLYKEENDQKLLVGHVLIEISSLCYHFLKKSKTNSLIIVITGKRLVERKELFPTLGLKFKKKGFYRKSHVHNK